MGNTIIYKSKGTERLVTQGFQQPLFDIINVTPIKEIPEAALIKTYPNPVNDELIAEYPSDKLKNLTLDITDIQGRVMLKMTLQDNAQQVIIPFQQYASGTYFLIFKQKGEIIKTLKVVKQF